MTDMVTIPRAEYEALTAAKEMLEDIAAFDAAKAALSSGDEELLPAELVNRLLDGENPVRLWREHRHLSMNALAQAAGVHRVSLSKVENGDRKLGAEMAQKLAAALNVSMDDLY